PEPPRPRVRGRPLDRPVGGGRRAHVRDRARPRGPGGRAPETAGRPGSDRTGDLRHAPHVTGALGTTLQHSPLEDRHIALGARLIDFAGWLMPVQYGGILEEHRAVRERAGLFDLSHMGELVVGGDGAGPALAAALVTNPPALAIGRAHYSMICAPDGGVIDDLIVYRLGQDRFMVVANASNAHTVS